MGVAFFAFGHLCKGTRGTSDYTAVSQAFLTTFPALHPTPLPGLQTCLDIFFVDWERARRVVPRGGGREEAAPVSCWRTLFVANEWNELQTLRLTSPAFSLFLLVSLPEHDTQQRTSPVSTDIVSATVRKHQAQAALLLPVHMPTPSVGADHVVWVVAHEWTKVQLMRLTWSAFSLLLRVCVWWSPTGELGIGHWWCPPRSCLSLPAAVSDWQVVCKELA